MYSFIEVKESKQMLTQYLSNAVDDLSQVESLSTPALLPKLKKHSFDNCLVVSFNSCRKWDISLAALNKT